MCFLRNGSSYSIDSNDEEAISSEVTSTDSATIQCLGDSCAENEDFIEVNEKKKHTVDMDTMLDNYDPTVPTCDELLSPQKITFAPDEGQVPLNVFNGPLNTKESDFLAQNVFLRNGSSYGFQTCTIAISMPENFRVC